MYSRILVPLDGSKLAERALPHSIQFARIFGSSLIILRVLDPSTEGEYQQTPEPFLWQVRKAEAEMYLKGVANTIREMGIEVDTALLEGKPSENIIDYAQSQKIDLLTISTHGAGGLSRWNTSSVFRKVVEKIYLPILVVRAYRAVEVEEGEDKTGFPTGVDKPAEGEKFPVSYKRILLPIDSSRRAECGLPAATALAEATGAQLILASIVRPPELPLSQPFPPEIIQLIDKFIAISHESAGSYLEELQNRLRGPVEIRLMDQDSVMHAIHNLAEQENADLVVFCAHGQTGRIDLPYGSVSRSYIEHGTRNALVIQDVHRSQVRPTEAEIAAEKYGRR